MGSSAMGASVLRNKIKAAGFPDVKVTNSAIANLSDTYDVVITHQDLTERAKPVTASAVHVSVDNFMNSPQVRRDRGAGQGQQHGRWNRRSGCCRLAACRGGRRNAAKLPRKPAPPASSWRRASS